MKVFLARRLAQSVLVLLGVSFSSSSSSST